MDGMSVFRIIHFCPIKYFTYVIYTVPDHSLIAREAQLPFQRLWPIDGTKTNTISPSKMKNKHGKFGKPKAWSIIHINVGAGPAGPHLARPLFWQFNEIHSRPSCHTHKLRKRTAVQIYIFLKLHACSVCAYYSRTSSKVLPTPLIQYI